MTGKEAAFDESQKLREEDTYWLLPVIGAKVMSVDVGQQLRLHLDSPGPMRPDFTTFDAGLLCINGRFTLGPPGQLHTLHVDSRDREQLGMSLNLFGAVVVNAVAHKDGRLEVWLSDSESNLVDGWQLTVEPDDRYESWEVRTHDGDLLVGRPGGDLEVFTGPSLGTVGELAADGRLQEMLKDVPGITFHTSEEPPVS